jgi:hypothetical protein
MEKYVLLVQVRRDGGGLPFQPSWHILQALDTQEAMKESEEVLQRYAGEKEEDVVIHLFLGLQYVHSGQFHDFVNQETILETA